MRSKIHGVTLNGHKHISTNSPIEEYLNPSVVDFLVTSDNMTHTLLKQPGEHVLMGEPVLVRGGRFDHYVCSSVSGTIVGVKKKWHASGKMCEMLEIENDHLDTPYYHEAPVINTREDFIKAVKDAGIVGMGGAGFPTYVKFLPIEDASIVIINAAECEPYITSDYMSIITEADKLIRGLKYIMKYNGAPMGVIAIKEDKTEAINALAHAIGEDMSVSVYLLKDEYPAGWEKYIVEHVTHKKYNALPRDVGAIVNNVQTAISICELLETGKPLIDRVVTVTGEELNNPHNFKIRIGTNINELLPLCGSYIDDKSDAEFICGGPMTGRSMIFDDLVLTATVGSVIIKKRGNGKTLACIGCGKCAENCPTHLTPTSIKLAFENKDLHQLIALNATKCMQCGLCSYVCPSRVEMTEAVGKAKAFVIQNSKPKR